MQKLYFILLGLFFLTQGNAQLNCKSVQGYAYIIVTIPGNMPVDDNGNPTADRLHKERFIYFITTCKLKPVINTVLYNSTVVKADAQSSYKKSFFATRRTDQKSLAIKPGKGKYLWKINIIENSSNPIPDKINTISVTGKIASKTFFVIIKEEIALKGPDTY